MILPDELVIDNFAGGGGASLGIKWAIQRPVDIAINHDREAVAMHAANHPSTVHLCQNIWQAHPRDVVKKRPVGLVWFSPDCKHHSKAKGGKPLEKGSRDLAWVVVHWIRELAKDQVQPRIIMLENVEEFRDWGPLCPDTSKPIVDLKGQTFKRWVNAIRREGYRVEWRELRACDYGTPTIRKRLLLIARRDGEPIVWPEPTHGPGLQPYRSAAECIDWSLPCPSIFMTKGEAKAYYEETGIRVKRPLAPNTMARIARGTKRFVLDAAEPFLVPVTHAGDARVYSVDEPLRTVTAAHRGEQALVSPYLARTDMHQSNAGCVYPSEDPLRTVTTGGGHAVVSPCLVPRYGERPGQEPRCRSVEEPLATVVTTGNQGSLVAAHLSRQFGASVGQDPSEPAPTIMPGGGGKTALVAAFMNQQNSGMVGHPMTAPVSTIVGAGSTQTVTAVHLSNQYTSNTRGGEGDPDKPMSTITAGGGHQVLVAAFLAEYYGEGGQWCDPAKPLNTVVTKDRFAVVTVVIDGAPYVITDIGMRMLTPRELFRAQGFPDSYVIDPIVDGKRLSKRAQISCCGNAVPPQWPAALISANLGSKQARAAS